MKLRSYTVLFRILSYLSDKTNGASVFVKYKIAIGTILISISGVSCAQKSSANIAVTESDSIEILDDSVVDCYQIVETEPSDSSKTQFVPPVISEIIEEEPNYYITCYDPVIDIDVRDTIPPLQVYKYGMIDVSPVSSEGDLESFRNWVQSNILYPEIMLTNKVQGRVVASFVINTGGYLTDIKILRSLNQEADNEAIRALSLSKSWTPGQHQGQAVDTEIILPVTFRIRE